MIVGVVLAAGRSRRMGAPKALLEHGGLTFLSRAVRALREGGCGRVVVVAGPPDDPVADAVARAARAEGARVVHNPEPGSEQVESLRVALRALEPGAEAAVVTPVDLPRIGPGVVRAVVEGFRRRGAPVVLPVHGGARGHPALFARPLFAELLAGDLPEGARTVIRAHEAELLEVPVEDPGIRDDVDTPADLRRLREGEP